ncbi:unnamed protein product, partial [Protopolystoma xenopodis]
MTLLVGVYFHLASRIRIRAAFLHLADGVKARYESKRALAGQLRWISAIMPTEVRNEYWSERQKYHDLQDSKMWVYCKVFDDVSILFADIVGFTKMSSNKTANKVVLLLNDLFNRFDDLCQKTKCEKIGTLGDCYYCVAGCPTPRSDHAVCCVEMGLGMCRIIKRFNLDHGEEVNMRVGIHTGR